MIDDLMKSEFEKFAKEEGYGSPWKNSHICPDWPLLSRNACWAWTAWKKAWVLSQDLPNKQSSYGICDDVNKYGHAIEGNVRIPEVYSTQNSSTGHNRNFHPDGCPCTGCSTKP